MNTASTATQNVSPTVAILLAVVLFLIPWLLLVALRARTGSKEDSE